MVGGHLHDGHVRQHVVLLAGHEAALLVEDGAHVLVGREQALHQEVALALVDELHGHGAGLGVVGLLDHLELVGVDALSGADLLHGLDVTHEGGLHDTAVDSGAHSGDGVGVIGISCHHSFLSFCFDQLKQVVKFCNHLAVGFLLLLKNNSSCCWVCL